MNTGLRLIIILLVGFCSSSHAQYDSIYHNSLYRTYLIHTPPSYNTDSPMPLVIAMHGGFGWGLQLQNQSQLSVKADAEGFIVVYPEGMKSPLGIRTWNAGGCCGYAMNNKIDDVGFIDALIDTLLLNYSIDTNRIYATGMSNGAFMSYRLAMEISHRIAAIAPVAGTMNVVPGEPDRGVPIIHFHSFLDTNVPYQGGTGSGVSNHYNPPLDSVLNAWSHFNNCLTQNDTVHNNNNYTHIVWSNCDCDHELHLYLTNDGGHSWPGGRSSPTGDPVSTAINANDLMWNFFQQHTLACSITRTNQNSGKQSELKIYPNPFSETAFIKTTGNANATLIMHNYLGEKVWELKNLSGSAIKVHRNNLPAGVYFIRLVEGHKIIATEKIIIAN